MCVCIFMIRLGLGSLVLEQADSLRTGGTSLTLFKNGWRVLDAIGVGNELRTQFLEIQGYISSFTFQIFVKKLEKLYLQSDKYLYMGIEDKVSG